MPGGGRPPKDNILEGLTNLETGKPAENFPSNYASMTAADQLTLTLDSFVRTRSRSTDCDTSRAAATSSGSPRIISQIDGRKTVAEIYTSLGAQGGAGGGLPQWEDFYAQFEDLYVKLNGVNHLLLRFRT